MFHLHLKQRTRSYKNAQKDYVSFSGLIDEDTSLSADKVFIVGNDQAKMSESIKSLPKNVQKYTQLSNRSMSLIGKHASCFGNVSVV